MLNPNMPVINGKLKIHLFNYKDEPVQSNQYTVYAKAYQKGEHWQEVERGNILLEGCVDLKLVVSDIVSILPPNL